MSTPKIALVTGGSRGLGKSMALNLAQKGIDVLITYHSKKDEAEAVVAEIQSHGRQAAALPLDAGNSGSFDAFFAQVKTTLRDTFQAERFQFLINNAGTALHAAFADTTEAQFDEMVNIHLKGPFFLTQKALPLLADGGRIINVSSGLARFSNPGSSAYASMKGAIEVLTRYQAKELGARHRRQRGGPRRHRYRFQRRHGARQPPGQRPNSRGDGPGPRGPARRHRPHRGLPLHRRGPLD